MFKQLLEVILKIMARAVLWKYQPYVIAITGSVGKTTTKEAIAAVVAKKCSLWKSEGNYNNEIGVPLAILGAESGKRNPLAWVSVLLRFARLMIGSLYPEILILELGADRPGNIRYLARMVRPAIAVVTRVGSAHVEFLGDAAAVQREKGDLVKSLGPDGIAVLNVDDPLVAAMRPLHRGRTVVYGFGEQAEVRASSLAVRQEVGAETDPSTKLGLDITIADSQQQQRISTKGLLGRPQAYALLAAYAVGRLLEIDPEEIATALASFTPPPGRLCPLLGVRNSIIIDDTFNASPEAVLEALKVLCEVKARRRIAVLGDMLELGQRAEAAHRSLGRVVKDMRIDVLWTVGEGARCIAEEARSVGFAKNKIKEFRTAHEAARSLPAIVEHGDVVLIKGSQAMRMEVIVEQVLAHPERASQLLVRQSADWKKK